MGQSLRVTVNGEGRRDEVEPRLLLVHYLRETCGLTGTHVGCDTSQCGACTVLLDGAAVKACNMLALQADGAEITTIEGLAPEGGLHPLQTAFWENHGLQCGYCTPGFIMAAAALSMPRIRAWGWGLRTTARCVSPGRVWSSMKRPWPVISRGSSRR